VPLDLKKTINLPKTAFPMKANLPQNEPKTLERWEQIRIYDRIREMLRRYKRMSMPELLNISVNSTLSRSIITHVTVTLALLALLLFGGHAIHSFVATMIFGVVLVGTYTSVFIAAPILIYLGVGTSRMEAEEPAEEAKTSSVKP